MAWGKSTSTPAAPASTASTASQLIPLIITFAVVGAIGWVLYQVYVSLLKIKAQAREQMGKQNVSFSKDGVRVAVQQVGTEEYVDKTQSWVVKAWNLSGPSAAEAKRNRKLQKHS